MFKDLYYYKTNADAVISRMNKLYDDAAHGRTGNIIFRVLLESDIEIYSSMKLDTYSYDTDIEKYCTDLCTAYELSFEARKELADDALPLLSPVLGIGDYSAFVGGDIYFAPDTSWSKPILSNLEDWKRLEPLGSSPWYKRFLTISEGIISRSKGSGIPFTRGFFSPLDLACALRGEELYTDFFDNPDGVHELLSYCADATIKFAGDIYAVARKHLGDTRYGMWYLDGAINMSEDIACMISGSMYREFAAPYTQRVIDHFGRGFMHSHSRALYLVKEICSLKNVVNLWLATDPNQPRPVDNLETLVPDSNGVCLSIDCESMEEIERVMKVARTGNISFCLPVSGLNEAKSVYNRFVQL